MTAPVRPEPILPWPIPGDTQLDQARTIACDLLRHLERVDPRMAQTLTARYQRFSINWLAPRRDFSNQDRWLTAEDVAVMASVGVKAVRAWTIRGLRRDGETVRLRRWEDGYSPRDVDDFLGRRNGAGRGDTPTEPGGVSGPGL